MFLIIYEVGDLHCGDYDLSDVLTFHFLVFLDD
jgi:hypothetical protein